MANLIHFLDLNHSILGVENIDYIKFWDRNLKCPERDFKDRVYEERPKGSNAFLSLTQNDSQIEFGIQIRYFQLGSKSYKQAFNILKKAGSKFNEERQYFIVNSL